jgi:hypothetical protein
MQQQIGGAGLSGEKEKATFFLTTAYQTGSVGVSFPDSSRKLVISCFLVLRIMI